MKRGLVWAMLASATCTTAVRGETQVVFLGTHQASDNPPQTEGGILARELFRQAVLIAARDELGLFTEDASIGDVRTPDAEELDLVTHIFPADRIEIELFIGGKTERKSILKGTLEYKLENPFSIAGALPVAERLARVEFPAALQSAGFQKLAPKEAPAAPLGKSLDQLNHMDFVELTAALRATHAQVRDGGPSLELVGCLVRGYANVALVARDHWRPAYKAYAARALLYGQRLVEQNSKEATARLLRGYALALAGLHGAALDDIAAAYRLEPNSRRELAWAPMIEAYCEYRHPALIESAARDDDSAQLASALALECLKNCGSAVLVSQAARRAIELNDRNLRACNALAELGGTEFGREGTEAGAAACVELFSDLALRPDLPSAVRTEVGKARVAKLPDVDQSVALLERARPIVSALHVPAPDARGEPSLAAIADLLNEAVFLELFRRIELLDQTLGVEVDDEVALALRIIGEHRYRVAIGARSSAMKNDATKRPKLFDRIEFFDATAALEPLLTMMSDAGPRYDDQAGLIRGKIHWHNDEIPDDLWYGVLSADPADRPRFARRLLAVSPHSPDAVVVLIRRDWKNAEPMLEQWLSEFAHCPQIYYALYEKHLELKQSRKAEEDLHEYLRLAPEAWAWQRLAKLRLGRGDLLGWKQALDEFLDLGGSGLQDTEVRNEIARVLMNRERWAEALPYAEAAAESWAQWAMETAAYCNQGVGQMERAAMWMRRAAERYDGWSDWLHWAVRTGHSSRAAAQELADRWAAQFDLNSASTQRLRELGEIAYFGGDLRRASTCFSRAFANDHYLCDGLFSVALAQELGDFELRDGILADILGRAEVNALAEDEPERDLADIARLWERATDAHAGDAAIAAGLLRRLRGTAEYDLNERLFGGQLLYVLGLRDEALELMCPAAVYGEPEYTNANLVREWLRRRDFQAPPARLVITLKKDE